MNYCFLSPHFPPNFYHFAVELAREGVSVYGIADAPWEELDHELREHLTGYYRVDDMNDYDQLVRAVGWVTHEGGKIDRLESHNEHWLEFEAALRTDFNIPGIKNDTISRIKHKSLMKDAFIEAGVPVARGQLVTDRETCERFIGEVGYPVIAKPDVGVGALKTYKINDTKELDDFFATKPDLDYFMEEFVAGQIISFDGLVNGQGEVVFATSHLFSQGVMETVNEDRDIWYHSLRDIPEDLEIAGKNLIRVFNLRERFFHIEFFRTPKGGLVALEVNMRPPGGLTTDMFNFANDINIYKEYAHMVATGSFELAATRPWHCAYVGRKFNKEYTRSIDAVVSHLGDALVHHQPIAGVFSSALGNYGFLVRATEESQIFEMARFIQEKA